MGLEGFELLGLQGDQGVELAPQVPADLAGERADKALAVQPGAIQALSNKAFAYLQDRDFGNGWPLYEHGAGHLKYRQVRSYIGEPRWQGELGDDVRLLVHSEQGIGDQIADHVVVVSRQCRNLGFLLARCNRARQRLQALHDLLGQVVGNSVLFLCLDGPLSAVAVPGDLG